VSYHADLELLVARGVCPERSIIESLGGAAMVLAGVAAKIDLMGSVSDRALDSGLGAGTVEPQVSASSRQEFRRSPGARRGAFDRVEPFRGIPERILEAGAAKDRLEPQPCYRRATPEAALLHWLYLARSPRSRMSAPPADLDLEALKARGLERLARAMGLGDALREWRRGV
jgi:hypothetical protein